MAELYELQEINENNNLNQISQHQTKQNNFNNHEARYSKLLQIEYQVLPVIITEIIENIQIENANEYQELINLNNANYAKQQELLQQKEEEIKNLQHIIQSSNNKFQNLEKKYDSQFSQIKEKYENREKQLILLCTEKSIYWREQLNQQNIIIQQIQNFLIPQIINFISSNTKNEIKTLLSKIDQNDIKEIFQLNKFRNDILNKGMETTWNVIHEYKEKDFENESQIKFLQSEVDLYKETIQQLQTIIEQQKEEIKDMKQKHFEIQQKFQLQLEINNKKLLKLQDLKKDEIQQLQNVILRKENFINSIFQKYIIIIKEMDNENLLSQVLNEKLKLDLNQQKETNAKQDQDILELQKQISDLEKFKNSLNQQSEKSIKQIEYQLQHQKSHEKEKLNLIFENVDKGIEYLKSECQKRVFYWKNRYHSLVEKLNFTKNLNAQKLFINEISKLVEQLILLEERVETLQIELTQSQQINSNQDLIFQEKSKYLFELESELSQQKNQNLENEEQITFLNKEIKNIQNQLFHEEIIKDRALKDLQLCQEILRTKEKEHLKLIFQQNQKIQQNREFSKEQIKNLTFEIKEKVFQEYEQQQKKVISQHQKCNHLDIITQYSTQINKFQMIILENNELFQQQLDKAQQNLQEIFLSKLQQDYQLKIEAIQQNYDELVQKHREIYLQKIEPSIQLLSKVMHNYHSLIEEISDINIQNDNYKLIQQIKIIGQQYNQMFIENDKLQILFDKLKLDYKISQEDNQILKKANSDIKQQQFTAQIENQKLRFNFNIEKEFLILETQLAKTFEQLNKISIEEMKSEYENKISTLKNQINEQNNKVDQIILEKELILRKKCEAYINQELSSQMKFISQIRKEQISNEQNLKKIINNQKDEINMITLTQFERFGRISDQKLITELQDQIKDLQYKNDQLKKNNFETTTDNDNKFKNSDKYNYNDFEKSIIVDIKKHNQDTAQRIHTDVDINRNNIMRCSAQIVRDFQNRHNNRHNQSVESSSKKEKLDKKNLNKTIDVINLQNSQNFQNSTIKQHSSVQSQYLDIESLKKQSKKDHIHKQFWDSLRHFKLRPVQEINANKITLNNLSMQKE